MPTPRTLGKTVPMSICGNFPILGKTWAMLKTFVLTAWRKLQKDKFYSLINIAGLAVGMTVSFMLLLYVWQELSFDSMHQNGSRLFLVFKNQTAAGRTEKRAAGSRAGRPGQRDGQQSARLPGQSNQPGSYSGRPWGHGVVISSVGWISIPIILRLMVYCSWVRWC